MLKKLGMIWAISDIVVVVVLFSLALKYQIQAGAELGQAQLKIGLDYILIFCIFCSLDWVW